MRSIIGSVAPLMPMTGYFNRRGEALTWVEGNLENWNAYFTLRGTGEIVYERKTFRTGVGELVLLAPGVPRSYRIPFPNQGWEFYWLHFRATPRLTNLLDWFNRKNVWQVHAVADVRLRVRLAEALEEAHQLNLTNPDLPGREAILEALVEAWLLRIAAATRQKIPAQSIDTRIERALEHFHRDISAAAGVGELAHIAGLSRSQFGLLFHKGTGRTPQQYVEERRLEMAAYYLRTTAQTISGVAETVGFANPFYFTLRFKKRFRKSPSDYRLNH
jgi:AraC family transcriptional regulator of arabinose operon